MSTRVNVSSRGVELTSDDGRVSPRPNDNSLVSLQPVVLNNLAVVPAAEFTRHALQLIQNRIGEGYCFHLEIKRASNDGVPEEAGYEISTVLDTVDRPDGPKMTANMGTAIREEVIAFATETLQEKTLTAVETEKQIGPRLATIYLLPVISQGEPCAILAAVGTGTQRNSGSLRQGLELLASLLHLGQSRHAADRDRQRFGQVAAFVEMLSTVETGADFPECSMQLANHLRDLLQCETVALATPNRWGRMHIAAVSGASDDTASGTSARGALLSLAIEAQRRSESIEFFGKTNDTATAGAAKGVSDLLDPAFGMAAPLQDRNEENRGAWIFLWNEVPGEIEEKRVLLNASAPEVAAMLNVLKAARPGAFRGSLIRFWRKASRAQRKFYTILGTAIALALCIPIPYPVKAPVHTEPVVRRVVAAPFDGILSSSMVRSGEQVAAGDIIAELDGREIRASLAEAVARRARSTRQADAHRSGGQIAEARMAELDVEALNHEIAILEHRRDNLTVRSPIDGLVLQGDLERSEGAPLTMGDPLFEVGPLDRLVFELGVEADDVGLLTVGDPVSVNLRVAGGKTVKGEISRIAPRSEIRENRNVFICEVEVENPDRDLRPGLEGRARISGPLRPIAWVWLRDAWLSVRYRLW